LTRAAPLDPRFRGDDNGGFGGVDFKE
jgi:hypothetical protein